MAGDAPIEHTRWPVVSLAEIASKIGSGATPKGGADTYLPTRLRYALVRSQNVFDRRFDYAGLAFITDEQADALRGVLLQPNDILLNITGDGVTFGRACTIPNAALPACVNQHVSIIRINSQRADAGYVLAFLTHPNVKSYIESFNAGGSRRAITKGHIESFRLPLPPLHEQRVIAHILGTLDDKIELNRRRNATLEAMARALFKAWFVDFDPVRAKLDGRWQRGQSLPGLPAHLYNLFPDRLIDSELGEIPEGWPLSVLGEHIDVERGLSYKGDGLRDDGAGLPMHNLNSIYEGGGYKYEGIKFYGSEYRDKHLVRPGEMIVTNTEQGFDHLLIGNAAIVPNAYGSQGLFSHHLYRIRVKCGSPFTPDYLVQLFNHPRWHQLVSGFSNGTTINMLPRDALSLPTVVVPPADLAAAFSVMASNARAIREASRQESTTLTTLRDTLLPKLTSGELRVKDVERIADEVAA